MKQFARDYPTAEQSVLNKNYRCREEIVRASSLLIEDNRERFAKNLQAEKQGGEKVKLHLFSSKEEEEGYIVEELKKSNRKIWKKRQLFPVPMLRPPDYRKFYSGTAFPFIYREKPAA